MKKYITSSADETRRVGELVAETLKSGDCVLLDGDLGAGKTVVASGIVKALTGESYAVTSPTFTIVNEYQGKTKVNHFDFYRIESVGELENIGIFEYLYSDAVNIIEWPARAPEVLGEDLQVVKVSIKKVSDTKREIVVED
ncbi:MAG: tRNA (adenosine(37)-N6)-threonylcarbamoyltransferase complex ATPase subunit type 1 TsaE [Clostridia bacterium]|nr:tRNA (adenosine(37)-N6)-threonylcarbamoyltransferase complex ATPase subunit type 1 TsaE [Clostridia bacterium]